MNKTRVLLKLACGAMLGSVCVSAYSLNAPLKVMPLGDSITAGYNVPGGYRTELYNLLVTKGYEVDFVGSMTDNPSSGMIDKDHEGHSGWKTTDLSGQITNWLNAANPDVILLHIGTNDISGGALGKLAYQRLNTLVGQIVAAKPNAKLIVASVIPRSDSLEGVSKSYNAFIPTVVSSYASQGKNVTYLNMHDKLTVSDLGDAVHPNASGYSKMANAWLDSIMAVQPPPPPVPEPATVIALAVGATAVLARRRRK